ncbi:MAG: peptide ABC transporter substrate-binding protein, partial [Devosia sp.]
SFVGNNFSGYASERMDAVLTELESSLDSAKLNAHWAEVQQIFSEELPMLPLYFYTTAWVAPVNLGGFQASPYDPEMTWAENWTLE